MARIGTFGGIGGMMNREWQYGKPPNETLVEVDGPLRVRAIWGRDGLLPHWESENRTTLWGPNAFTRWRHLTYEGVNDDRR